MSGKATTLPEGESPQLWCFKRKKKELGEKTRQGRTFADVRFFSGFKAPSYPEKSAGTRPNTGSGIPVSVGFRICATENGGILSPKRTFRTKLKKEKIVPGKKRGKTRMAAEGIFDTEGTRSISRDKKRDGDSLL